MQETVFGFAAGAVPADAWQVVRFRAREAMSTLYECAVVLAMEPGGAPLVSLLGADARLTVQRGARVRSLQGVVREVEELGSTASQRFVRVVVVPRMWALSQRSDCRIFQGLTVVAIVREVLRAAGVYAGSDTLRVDASLDAMAPREYCVQYQETDLAFVQRLLEDEGVPYYFTHDGDGGETLVLAGDGHGWQPVPTGRGVIPLLDDGAATADDESLRWFDERHQLQPTSVTVRDFDFSRPQHDLSRAHPSRAGARALYEYPARATLAGYDDDARAYQGDNGARLARVRQEAWQSRAHEGRGRGNVTGMMPGRAFVLDGHTFDEANRAYLVTAVEHEGDAWTELPDDVAASERVTDALREHGLTAGDLRGRVDRYRNRVTTCRTGDGAAPHRPLRTVPRPIVEGPQTAWVVGPPGEEIHTDPHGRIKVQFHWDRQGRRDDRSSCWIRLAQSSSGPGWGFTVLPRVGMEVVVSFLEGDPDRPLVTGCVTNGENGSSYPLPEMKTRSVIKTWSSPRTGGYNELRFEDRAGEEQLYIQAERDHDTLVKHDQTLTVQRHRTKRVQGDEHNTIEQNRVTHVLLDNVRTVDGNQEVEVHGAQGASLLVDQNRDVRVGRNADTRVGVDMSLRVGANQSTEVGANQRIVVGANRATKVGANHATEVGANQSTEVGASQSTTVGASRTTKVGANQRSTVGANRDDRTGMAHSASVGLAQTLSVGVAKTETVGAALDLEVGASHAESAGVSRTMKVGKVMTLDVGDQLVIRAGGSALVLQADGIYLQGEAIHLLASTTVNVDGPDNVFLNSGTAKSAPEPQPPPPTSLAAAAKGVDLAKVAKLASALRKGPEGLLEYFGNKDIKALFKVKKAVEGIVKAVEGGGLDGALGVVEHGARLANVAGLGDQGDGDGDGDGDGGGG